MYCGSCLRDNALAAELMARGHDVSLLPVYTPTRTDEAERQRRPRVLRRHQRLPAAARAAVPAHARPSSTGSGTLRPSCARSPAGRMSAVDPRFLGEMTVSMLRGEDGLPGQGDREARATGCAGSRRSTSSCCPTRCCSAWPRRSARALGRPVVLHAAGRGPLPRRPSRGGPRRSRCGSSARTATPSTRFIAVSDFYAEPHGAATSDLPRDADAHGAPRHPRRGDEAAPPPRERPTQPFTVGFFARIAPEKGLHLLAEAYAHAAPRRAAARRPPGGGGLPGPRAHGYLEEIQAGLRRGRAGRRVPLSRRRWTARPRCASCARSTSPRCPAPTRSRRGCPCWRRWPAACRSSQPRHGAFPEMLGRTGGGLLFAPGDVAAPRGGGRRAPRRSRTAARPWASRARAACGASTRSARMAERAIEVYDEAVRDGRARGRRGLTC